MLNSTVRENGVKPNQTFSLPGVPTITCLELGYTLNEFGRISDIFIVCPNGKYSNHWEWGIDSGDLDESNLPIELPPDLPPSGLAEEEKPRRRYSGKEEESHEEQGASSESEGEQ